MGVLGILAASWNNFFDNTSASGASNAARSKHPLRKTAWLFIFVLGLTLTIWGVYQVVVEYLSYPVSTTIALRHYSKIQFPAVTICNQNRVDCERLQRVIEECQLTPGQCQVNVTKVGILEKINASSCPLPPQEALQLALASGLGALGGAVGDVLGGVGDTTGIIIGGDTSDGGGGGGLLGGILGEIRTPLVKMTLPPLDLTSMIASIPEITSPTISNLSLIPNPTIGASIPYVPSPQGTSQNAFPIPPTLTPPPIALSSMGTHPNPDIIATSVYVPEPTDPSITLPGLGRKKRSLLDNETLKDDRPADVALENEFLELFMRLDNHERASIGHAFDEFVLTCTFREGNCKNSSFFWPSQSPNYGNCYTFNSGINGKDPQGGRRVSSMSGPSFGLTLVLNLNQTNYMQRGQTTQAGARMVIHSSHVRPMTDEFGNDLIPNTLNSVAVQEIVIGREPAPYTSDCITEWSKTNYSDFIPSSGYNYTLSLCQRFCLMTTFQDTCGCFHPHFLEGDMNRGDFLPCSLTHGSNQSECITRVIEEVDVGVRNCSCKVECLESDYKLSLSQSQWPSTQFSVRSGITWPFRSFMGVSFHFLFQDEAREQYGFAETKPNETSLEQNLVKIRVFFNSLNIQHVTESPKYSWSDGTMISALGGALSLYLGISVVMAIEFLEFLIDVILNVYSFGIRGKKVKDQTTSAKGSVAWGLNGLK
ncbi:degenerin-like protein asic-1 isoform X3 [Tigriopus californicus]|nr:degenerin-like protein asic-1 isoform X3 [Tigriopus californicus]